MVCIIDYKWMAYPPPFPQYYQYIDNQLRTSVHLSVNPLPIAPVQFNS
jgi:hypothetical protein